MKKTPKVMTEKQERFAHLVGAEGYSLSAAYREAYQPKTDSDNSVAVSASRLAQNPNVALRIDTLRNIKRTAVEGPFRFSVDELAKRYLAIAMADPNELIGVKVGACRHCWGRDGAFHWKEHEYLDAVVRWEAGGMKGPAPDPTGGLDYRFTAPPNPECIKCEGEGLERVVPRDTTKLSPGALALYRGVQQTKEGPKILFANQDKALEQIGRILGAFDDKLRIDLEAKVASYKLTTTDPTEAAAAYNRMLTGTAK